MSCAIMHSSNLVGLSNLSHAPNHLGYSLIHLLFFLISSCLGPEFFSRGQAGFTFSVFYKLLLRGVGLEMRALELGLELELELGPFAFVFSPSSLLYAAPQQTLFSLVPQ